MVNHMALGGIEPPRSASQQSQKSNSGAGHGGRIKSRTPTLDARRLNFVSNDKLP